MYSSRGESDPSCKTAAQRCNYLFGWALAEYVLLDPTRKCRIGLHSLGLPATTSSANRLEKKKLMHRYRRRWDGVKKSDKKHEAGANR